MSTSGSAGTRMRGLRGEQGFSLVEAMVALAAAVVVSFGLYQVFQATQRSAVSQRLRNDVQTNCSFALDRMKNEIALGGYRAINAAQPISNAAGGSITFEYWDDHASFAFPYDTSGFDNHTQVTYRVAAAAESGGVKAGDLVREIRRFNKDNNAYEQPLKQVLVDNIKSVGGAYQLGFTYFQEDNQLWAGTNLGAIRTVRIGLTCEAARPAPVGAKPSVTLTAEVRARNVGVSETPKDTVPPAVPTGALAWDPGQCGTLQVRWNANTDADLEGYTLFYGLSSGSYSGKVRLPRPPRTAGQFEYYTLTGLTSAKTTDVTSPVYYVALEAFDKSGNKSTAFSTAASGNPDPSLRTESAAAASGSDTTIHPALPGPPTGLTAVPTPSVDGSITLAWTPPADVGLAGYRLYRGETPTFTVDDRVPVWSGGVNTGGNRVAEIAGAATSFTDNGVRANEGKLVGCQTYYYKLAPVICDPTLTSAYTSAQYATASAAPTDNEPPANPVISARPGYRRIILTLTNPSLYGAGSDPDFVRTTVHWSRTGFPSVDGARHAVSASPTIPRSGGTFTGGGTLPTINFNDENSASASSPNLAPDTTYYFLAVAYDRCGNHTGVNSSSIAEGTQCGDCLMPAPAPLGTPDPACYEAPSGQQPTGVDAEGCYGFADLSWNPIDDIVLRDFQGFRIQRREGASWVGGINEVNLTGDDAAWLTTFRDATLEEGKRYSYRIMATDCYYEQWHGRSPAEWPEPGNDPNDNFREAFLQDVAVGRPLFDPARPEVVTGSLAGNPPDFNHNPVSFWVRNASDTRLTMQTLNVSWDNPDAYLQRIVVGDGNTTPVTTAFEDAADPLTHGFSGSAVTLATTTRLEPLDSAIPFENRFLNVDRGVTRTADMRSALIDYTLNYRNDSTGTEACSVTSSVLAPLGPYVYSVSQDKPYFGTLGWPVPGDEGFNSVNAVIAPGGADVTVFAEVLDASLAGIATGDVKLYYTVDDTKALSAAPAVSGTYPSLNYTALTMARVAGDQWRATIPAVADANVWYFVVAEDAHGNFDRDPEPWAGAYQYFQPPPDNCSTIPNPPTISGATSGGNVTLNWTPASTNATPTGLAYTDAAGYKIYRNRGDGTGWHVAFGGVITNPATTTWTDVAVFNLDSFAYQYYVVSVDQCTPTPNESAASNIFSELVEGVCGNTPSPPVISGFAAALPDRVQLTWTPPTSNEPPSIAPLTDLGGYQVWRKTLTGPWTMIMSLGPATLTFLDTGAANIKSEAYSYHVRSFDTCSTPGPRVSGLSNIYTEPLVNNPCDEVPMAATLTGSSGATSVSLSWTPPTNNTNGEVFQDGGGYKVWRGRDGATPVPIALLDSATFTFVDTTVGADIGTSVYRYHVTVIDSCGTPNESAASNVFTENYSGPCATTPVAPSLSGVSSAAGVTLTWIAPAFNTDGSSYGDPAGFRVYRRRGSSGAWGKLADLGVGTLSYLDTAVTADIGAIDYHYYVTAFDSCSAANESAPSGLYVDSFTDPCIGLVAPSAPGALTVVLQNGNDTTSDLSWTAAIPAPDGYRVYGCSQPDGTTTCTCTPTKISSPDPLTGTTFTHSLGTTKSKDIVWCYAVKAVTRGACTVPSSWAESGFNSGGIQIDPQP